MFSFGGLPEPEDDEGAARHCPCGGLLPQSRVRHGDVEDGGERSGDVVEGDADVLQAEVVGGDHGQEDDGQWKNYKGSRHKNVQASPIFNKICHSQTSLLLPERQVDGRTDSCSGKPAIRVLRRRDSEFQCGLNLTQQIKISWTTLMRESPFENGENYLHEVE